MKKVSKTQAKELKALAVLPDDEIDLTDIPEVLDWSGAIIGKYYRPLKKSLTIRLDADVLARLKSEGHGYQTRINRLLRTAMETRARRRRLTREPAKTDFAVQGCVYFLHNWTTPMRVRGFDSVLRRSGVVGTGHAAQARGRHGKQQ